MGDNRNLGYHVHGDGPGVKDRPRFLAHVARYQPCWMLVINDIGLAHAIKSASPTTNVFIRWQMGSDNGYWVREGAAAFLDHCLAKDPQRLLWHIGANEVNNVDNDAALVQEMRLRIAAGKPCPRVGVCNYSVGQPSDAPIAWESINGLVILKGASDFPEHIVVVLHDGYFMGYPTVGWQGSRYANPDPKTWPVRGGSAFGEDGKPINWILGRHKNAVAAFRKVYPNAPLFRVVYGEAGPESIPEFNRTIKRELKGGWKNQQQYWGDVWGLPPDEALYLCIYWLIMAGLADSPEVEGVLLFAYGWNGDEMWEEFDVESLGFFHQMVEAWQCPAQLPQLKAGTPTPQPTPEAKTWQLVRVLEGDYAVKLRQKPNTTSQSVLLFPGMLVSSTNTPVLGEMIRPANGAASAYWLRVTCPVTVGVMSGYVSAAYAKLVEPTVRQWVLTRTLKGDYAIRLRKEPRTTSPQLGKFLTAGTIVESTNVPVDGEAIFPTNGAASDQWLPVTVNGLSGYVSAAYAKLVMGAA